MLGTPTAVIVLAAGKGTRMRSAEPKVLHRLAGRPMIRHLLETVAGLGPERTVCVLAPGMDAVAAAVPGTGIAVQAEQRGTADAVLAARAALADFDGDILILFADTPLVGAGTMRAALEALRSDPANAVCVLGMRPRGPEPIRKTGYGRRGRAAGHRRMGGGGRGDEGDPALQFRGDGGGRAAALPAPRSDRLRQRQGRALSDGHGCPGPRGGAQGGHGRGRREGAARREFAGGTRPGRGGGPGGAAGKGLRIRRHHAHARDGVSEPRHDLRTGCDDRPAHGLPSRCPGGQRCRDQGVLPFRGRDESGTAPSSGLTRGCVPAPTSGRGPISEISSR